MPNNRVPFDHPWGEDLIGKVASVTVGGTPRTHVSRYWDGDIPWMSSGDVNLRRILDVPGRITAMGLSACNAKIVKPPAVAIGLAGQGRTRGTAAITCIPLCSNQSVALIQGFENELDTSYLFHNLAFRYEELRGRSAGGGRAGLSKEILEIVPIPLPLVDEQMRIARVLNQVDAVLEQTECLIEKLKRLKVGLLHDLLTRGVDEHGVLRDPVSHPELFRMEPGIGLVPKEWEPCQLVKHMEFPEGQVDPRFLPYRKWPLVAPDHIESGTGRLLAVVSAEAQGAISGKYAFETGDILYSKIRPYLRKAVIAPFRGLCSADMYPLRPTPRIASGFLLMIILGEQFSRYAKIVSVRSGFPKINRGEMAGYKLALPKRNEQELSLAIYESFDKRLRNEESILHKLRLKKQGLAHDLLTGRKRVPVDLTSTGELVECDSQAKHKANIFFKRSVLAAEIVEQMHAQPTFGHVKFQKTLFLCERMAGVSLGTHYHRAAAGPHDSRLMRSVDGQMAKQNWFRKVPRETGPDGTAQGWAYVRLEKAGEHRKWFEKYWAPAQAHIQRVIDLLKPAKTQQCEIVATLFSAWEDLLKTGSRVTDDLIVNEVLNNWHPSKQAIARERWEKALDWMREKGLVPVATGGAG